MPKERILITVKTYPTLSSSYDETVCTAGLRPDGTWFRVYPIAFRKMDEFEKFKKFDWVEIDIERNFSDPRPESFKKRSEIIKVGEASKDSNWYQRNQQVLRQGKVFTHFEEIIAKNKNNRELSLATFKPSKIIDLEVDAETNRDWDPVKLRQIQMKAKQNDLFEGATDCFEVVNKLPYKFRYRFTDEVGKERRLIITDWEIGALYWNCLKRRNNREDLAIEDVKNKYLKDLVHNRDIHFFVGTTHEWDLKNAPNPFTIIGVYSPPKDQQSAFDF